MKTTQTTLNRSLIELILACSRGEIEVTQEPMSDVKPGEKVHGILEDPVARAIYTLMADICDELSDLKAKHKDEAKKDDGKPCETCARIARLDTRRRSLNGVFFDFAFSAFPAAGADIKLTIGIRKGWKIVTVEQEKRSEPEVVILEVSGDPGLGALLQSVAGVSGSRRDPGE